MLAMRNRFSVPMRLVSLMTLLLFAGAGIGFSMADALRFHGRGNDLSGQAHYDPAGGCREHSENCVLLFWGSTDRAQTSDTPETRLPPEIFQSPVALIGDAPSHQLFLAPSSRAPPLLLA